MHYHIILTQLCNSNCKYCYEKSMNDSGKKLNHKFKFDFSEPQNSKIDINKLKDFIEKDKNAVIIFYGGEPLLEIPKIIEIMKNISVPFRMQTNGKLLNELPIEYLKKISKILISIDGEKKITDFNRGEGTYEKIISNIQQIKNQGYNGELIARITLSQENPDIEKSVKYLLKNSEFNFNSIHWQIDAGFYESDFNKKKFEKFAKKYNLSISKLINFWIDEMKKGNVLKIYPFIAITNSLLKNEKTLLRCGAGHSGYAITTSGKIVACPIMNSIKDFEAGDLNSDNPKLSNPQELKKFPIEGICKNCDYLNLCGGRCLYWNKTNLWPEEGNTLICNTIKHLIDELKNIIPEINSLLKNKTITLQDFKYEKYFGPEIIP